MHSCLFKAHLFAASIKRKRPEKSGLSIHASDPFGPERLSGSNEVTCGHLARAAVLHQLVGELLAVVESGEARTLNSGDVNEYVLRTVVRLNEAVALGCVEPLYCTSRHNDFLPLAIVFALQAVRTWVEFEGKDRRERLERRRSSGRQTNIDGEVRRLEGVQSQVSLNRAVSKGDGRGDNQIAKTQKPGAGGGAPGS